jgi:hypothetical protein
MLLTSISYKEFAGTPREWSLEEVHLNPINLVVGRNASGKSRFLNIISGLAKLLTGELPTVFESAEYRVSLAGEDLSYTYELTIAGRAVVKEVLVKDGETLINRGADGSGKIWAARLKQQIDFEAPRDVIAARVRRDAIQHPFLKDLHDWASFVRHYPFGTTLGRDRLYVNDLALLQSEPPAVFDANAVVQVYLHAFTKFGEAFDAAILRDLGTLGYDCTDVGAEQFPVAGIPEGKTALTLFVREKNLPVPVTQLTMSAGMFRAVALVIHLNDCLFRKLPCTLLIDDIGEGLDFARSSSFISLLTTRAEENVLQIIMTTNDRFVMNDVPLKYWAVITRDGGKVRTVNAKNSPKLFADFENLGLNNFDFFSTGFFDGGMKES